MKKSIVLGLFVCLAMSLSAFAQSDNAAFVLNKADGTSATLGALGSAWDGNFVFVANKSGNINFQFTGELREGFPGVESTTRFSFTGGTPLGAPFVILDYDCVATKSGRVNCSGKEPNI